MSVEIMMPIALSRRIKAGREKIQAWALLIPFADGRSG
jgi:hypothetical protein